LLEKHSISIRGHRTSYSLEPEFYAELQRIAKQQQKPLAKMITELDEARSPQSNLSSTLRVFVLEDLKQNR